jgi:hypothetical protein
MPAVFPEVKKADGNRRVCVSEMFCMLIPAQLRFRASLTVPFSCHPASHEFFCVHHHTQTNGTMIIMMIMMIIMMINSQIESAKHQPTRVQ